MRWAVRAVSGTAAGAAAARAIRTRRKHERWAAELAVAGWSVVEASPIQLWPGHNNMGENDLTVRCSLCHAWLGEWNEGPASVLVVPLPQVLAKVDGHLCPEAK